MGHALFVFCAKDIESVDSILVTKAFLSFEGRLFGHFCGCNRQIVHFEDTSTHTARKLENAKGGLDSEYQEGPRIQLNLLGVVRRRPAYKVTKMYRNGEKTFTKVPE